MLYSYHFNNFRDPLWEVNVWTCKTSCVGACLRIMSLIIASVYFYAEKKAVSFLERVGIIHGSPSICFAGPHCLEKHYTDGLYKREKRYWSVPIVLLNVVSFYALNPKWLASSLPRRHNGSKRLGHSEPPPTLSKSFPHLHCDTTLHHRDWILLQGQLFIKGSCCFSSCAALQFHKVSLISNRPQRLLGGKKEEGIESCRSSAFACRVLFSVHFIMSRHM